ncbi:hypothetical protein [Luteolibacter marinus]|uniref:hypothetical protein n=1 Tax=Luteolibacter marinus TaxID=2776705 RepID=UPI001868BFF5|nr:hypothetical protein [Luteolibacter marinus]
MDYMTRQLSIMITVTLGGAMIVALNCCGMYDPALAASSPRYYSVKEGAAFLTDQGQPLYVEKITPEEVTVSWRNWQSPWSLPLKMRKQMGNGRFLEVVEIDSATGTAEIKYSELDRRGIEGAWAF